MTVLQSLQRASSTQLVSSCPACAPSWTSANTQRAGCSIANLMGSPNETKLRMLPTEKKAMPTTHSLNFLQPPHEKSIMHGPYCQADSFSTCSMCGGLTQAQINAVALLHWTADMRAAQMPHSQETVTGAVRIAHTHSAMAKGRHAVSR